MCMPVCVCVCVCVGGAGRVKGIWDISVPSLQFCCASKTGLKK